ncbi:hypothetical protein HNR16_001148 [Pseudoclavibacter chungangensis]|nr:hypothetical protein [Pseudoclavibacter chungangensis]
MTPTRCPKSRIEGGRRRECIDGAGDTRSEFEPAVRGPDTGAIPCDEHIAEVPLETCDLFGDGRLGRTQLVRGGREGSGPVDREEHAQCVP